MTRPLRQRARRNGTRSIFAGDEPRDRELVDHWPKPVRKRPKISKRERKRSAKDRANERAATASYQARLAASWALVRKEDD